MEKKIVEIGGKEFKVGFSMAVAIEWEKLTGKAWDVRESLGDTTGQMTLCYAAVKHYNKDVELGGIEEWLDGLSFVDSAKVQGAVAECMGDFYVVPGAEHAEEGEGEKNA